MAKVIKHRKVNIVVLEPGEGLEQHARAGDIVLLSDDEGWWVRFVGGDGKIDCYGEPFPSEKEALWTAKAAAEYGLD
ncbi:hypothetical protein ACLB1G_05620 [Oxalobacteraceae bacterium A2-2]